MGVLGKPVDLGRAIEAAVADARRLADVRPVSVVAEYPAHLPTVIGDPDELARVVGSLIERAIEATGRGEVKVRAALLSFEGGSLENRQPSSAPQALSDLKPGVLVTVSGARKALTDDSGTADAPRATPSAGQAPFAPTMPLEACRAAVEGYGGLLWADPPDGEASRFSFALPLQAATLQDADISSLRQMVESRLPVAPGAAPTLLLVMDQPEMGNLLLRDLSAAGYRVVLSYDGGEGVGLARNANPDVILLDLMIRQPPAFDIAYLLKQDRRTRHIPVLFLTFFDQPDGEVAIRAVNYLVRPSGTGALVTAINALLTSGVSSSARVLVVEQDAAVRDMMVLMIQETGYRVTVAAGAEEAVALAERVPLGLILVNARLAQERDFWLLRTLRQLCADAGIYVLAGQLSEAEGRAAVSRGASGYSDTGKLPDLLDRVRDGSKGE